jgi:hypothetical protein
MAPPLTKDPPFADYFVRTASQRTPGRWRRSPTPDEGGRGSSPRREGERGGWTDRFGDVILHLFSQDLRDYYRLEDIWRTGRVVLRVQ